MKIRYWLCFLKISYFTALCCRPNENVKEIWPTKMNFSWPNVKLGLKMANGPLLSLVLLQCVSPKYCPCIGTYQQCWYCFRKFSCSEWCLSYCGWGLAYQLKGWILFSKLVGAISRWSIPPIWATTGSRFAVQSHWLYYTNRVNKCTMSMSTLALCL